MAGPIPSPFLVTVDPVTGQPCGVAVMLAETIGRELGLPVACLVHHRLADLDVGARTDTYDLAFLPVTAERKAQLAFGRPYFRFRNVMLARASSDLRHMREVDRPGQTIAVQAGTVQAVQLARQLRYAALMKLESLEALSQAWERKHIHVVAHAAPLLSTLQRRWADARLLAGHYSVTSLAVAVPRDRSQTLPLFDACVAAVRRDGRLAKAFAAAGLHPDGSVGIRPVK